MAVEHVKGRDAGHIMLYALSTCGWCKKARELLDGLGVAYDYEYVDLLHGEEREKAVAIVRKWNPACNFPTLVINDQRCIAGFQEEKIREAVRG